MSDVENRLRQHLATIRQAALLAVDPAEAVRRHLKRAGSRLTLGEAAWDLAQVERVFVVGAGKAAVKMTQAAAEMVGEQVTAGVVVTKYLHSTGATLPPAIRVMEAGHPVPDAAGMAGAQAIADLLKQAGEKDLVLVLLSGGASALIPYPAAGISLEDLQQMTTLLLHCGATIAELNAVRKHLDGLKGGQLARLAYPAPLAAMILSDVVGDPLEVIASGPTVADPSTFQAVYQILENYELLDQAPPAVMDYIRAGMGGARPETPKPGDAELARVENVLVGSNRLAAQEAAATATSLGYRTLLLSTFLEGEAREVGKVMAALAKGVRFNADPLAPPACIVMGGETTVTVNGPGKGGRNQELALSAALALDGLRGVALMALATDGTDGPTDSAGAVVDGTSKMRMAERGFDALACLKQNDSYPALAAVGDLMITGPTGTNVNDLMVLLVG